MSDQFNQPDLGLPSREYYLDPDYRWAVDAYIRLATNVALEFGADVNTAEQQIRDAVAFETTLANVRYKRHRHLDSETNNTCTNKTTRRQNNIGLPLLGWPNNNFAILFPGCGDTVYTFSSF